MEPAEGIDEGPPLWFAVTPAVTMVVAPLMTTAGSDLACVLVAGFGAVVGFYCFYRRVFTALPLAGWNVMLVVWAGYDLL